VRPVTLLVVAALIVLPWIDPDKFALHILSLIAIASIAAMGLQVLLGYSGQLSIGQAAFYGIGAYTSALLTAKLAVYFTFARIEGSRFGRAINAIRQDADAARASGIGVTLLKSECFVIAAFVAGLAGSLYAHEVRYLAPNDFTFWKSIELLIMVVIGGVGSLAGAILGAAVVVGLPEYLRAIGDYRMLVFGAILIATMLFGEGGLAALFATLGRRVAAVSMRSASKLPPGNEAAR